MPSLIVTEKVFVSHDCTQEMKNVYLKRLLDEAKVSDLNLYVGDNLKYGWLLGENGLVFRRGRMREFEAMILCGSPTTNKLELGNVY